MCVILPRMTPYPIELRERIVGFVNEGGSKTEAARIFKIARSSVYRFLDAHEQGQLEPKPCGGSEKRFTSEKLQNAVADKPSATLDELGATIGVTRSAIWKRLRQIGITRKKNSCATPKGTSWTDGSFKRRSK